jgi:D-alanyl-D-alanine carboxypeptidase
VSIKSGSKSSKSARAMIAAVPLPPSPPPAAAETHAPRSAKMAALVAEEAPKLVTRSLKKQASDKPVRSGWMIQVGAFDDKKDAQTRLSSVRSRAKKLLRGADPFTEPVTKGEKTLYRARFAGLDKHQAEAACRALKRSDIGCLAIKN